ncbi:hypothetical protein GCM10009677_05750 [Sphaerisporangium rubeum]|uniref:DNA-binding SARP family transcriptional activator/tetratricopeptide (TPR) repeat protein n=1 Tax=Sphaerisporangium rubeum TaxID=321317 RepID=A0A7X0M576_9ACTN|nr:DNA-binding SARP family transcriptional activator/tetratricopeptide (TPR) repeat protein [Sphaerisporangium rubeum]
MLLIEANRTVPVDELIDRVWGTRRLPRRPRGAVQHSVTLLRRALASAQDVTIAWRSTGYQLTCDPSAVDVRRFRSLLGSARATGDDELAAATFEQALELWRGEPFTGLDTPWISSLRRTLIHQRQAARLDLTDIQLRRGLHTALLADLRDWAEDDPLDERLAGQYMLALYRSGRQARALEHYAHVRRCLAEQMGADPGPLLQRLHRQILTADQALVTPAAVPHAAPRSGPTPPPVTPVACTLPADLTGFAGRGTQVREIIAKATEAAHTGRMVAVHAVDGMPGVGKTALAVHVGHLVADLFPDRQLFVDLHAHTAGRQPTEPADALGVLLAADGLDPRDLPEGLEERAAMWRDRMAGKRALLILDNAAGSDQVAPLLPGAAGSLVLITSRRHLGDLPAAVDTVSLATLHPDEAQQMFLRLAPRAASEPARVGELVAMCGHLPLAISLLARLFTKHRAWSMGDLIAETAARLLVVTAENHTVGAAFDLSYRHLTADRQRVFRHLGLHSGVDIDTYAAAALTGLPHHEVVAHLDALQGDHLVNEHAFRRYRMHDLIREYARVLAAADPAGEREQAVERLLDYYQHTAARADTRLARLSRPTVTPVPAVPAAAPELRTRDEARRWLNDERGNLLAYIEKAAERRPARMAALTAAVASYLRAEGPWSLASDLHRAAVDATARSGDRCGHVIAMTDLAGILCLMGDHPGATDLLREARDICREAGDRRGEAHALHELGVVRTLTGCHAAANRMLRQALDLHREVGERLDQASDLHILGVVGWLSADYGGARVLLWQALDIYREIGDRHGEAVALTDFGTLRLLTGDTSGADVDLSRALAICRQVGDRLGQANALVALATARWRGGDRPGATTMLRQALGIYREIGDRRGQAAALNRLGVVRSLSGDLREAAELLRRALEIHRRIGDRDGEAETLNNTGSLSLTCGDPAQARLHHGAALRLARAIPNRLEEARALEGDGRAAEALGERDTAARLLRQALTVYERIGAPEAGRLAPELDTQSAYTWTRATPPCREAGPEDDGAREVSWAGVRRTFRMG